MFVWNSFVTWIENVTSYNLISSKIWSENRIFVLIHSGIVYFWIWLFGGAKYQEGEEAEARDTDEQPLSDK